MLIVLTASFSVFDLRNTAECLVLRSNWTVGIHRSLGGMLLHSSFNKYSAICWQILKRQCDVIDKVWRSNVDRCLGICTVIIFGAAYLIILLQLLPTFQAAIFVFWTPMDATDRHLPSLYKYILLRCKYENFNSYTLSLCKIQRYVREGRYSFTLTDPRHCMQMKGQVTAGVTCKPSWNEAGV